MAPTGGVDNMLGTNALTIALPTDEDEEDGATPRPKFDFSDLQFGSNYPEETGKKKK